MCSLHVLKLHLTEYVNGQRTIYLHPSGYLVSQQDGAWIFEEPSPHSQPSKVCRVIVQEAGIHYYVMPGEIRACYQLKYMYQLYM